MDELPARIGRYEIRARIATGATAEVFLAQAPGAPLVALKRLHPHLADDADAVALLLEEARIAARFDHPAAAPVVDLGCEDGAWFIAFELVAGVGLAALAAGLAARGERLAPGAAVAVALELASAVAALHRLEGLVHGDISPSNVLVARDGAVRLVDLGAAAALARGVPGVFGTPGYVAPEQARGEPVRPPADVFSIGAILFELLAGAPAYRHDGLSGLAAPLDAPSLARRLAEAGVDAALAAVVARALAPEEERRIGTAQELVEALAPFATPPGAARRELAEAAARASAAA